jgi:two-component system cell cycle response regulator
MSARILVIEDNATNLDLMAYLLTAFGHTPLTAHDGEEGLLAAQRERPDLIICDMQLPILDGYEVARWLKSHPNLRAIPLVAVTALAMVGDRDKVLASGFDGYIAKPIDPQTFVGQVERFLQRERGATPPAFALLARTVAAPQAWRVTILVVDNMPLNIELARSTLEPFGYAVIPALAMAEALDLARRTPPDMILSDVNMADGTGYDFITAVKADPQLCAIPFVLITSTYLDPKEQAYGLDLGAARFLVRPIEPQALLDALEACLPERPKDQHGDNPVCAHSDCR